MEKNNPPTVLITGASRGLGLTIAKHLKNNHGFVVYGTSRTPDEKIEAETGIKFLSLDLNNQNSIDELALHFTDRVDILINNAGQSQLGAFEDIPEGEFKYLLETNFYGSLRLTKALIPKMRENKSGLIINISSLIASFPLPYYTSYTTSKAAFTAFSYSLNMELRPFGINVVVIEPNDLRTSIEPKLFIKDNSPYMSIVTKMRDKIRTKMSKSENPEVITKVIDKIINAKRPKPKYVVGGNAWFLILIKRFLTSAMQLKLTSRSYEH